MVVMFESQDIVSIADFSAKDILFLCQAADRMRELEEHGRRYAITFNHPKRLATLFYEPSTRTMQSFKTAIAELGGSHDGFLGKEGTSVMKKETIRDTILMYEANHFDIIVMRHPADGSVQWAADVARIPVINGGDGKNEHPTQSLLDLFTLYRYTGGKLAGIKIGFGGDLAYGRTVRSLCLALSCFEDVHVYWAAPDFLGMPNDLCTFLTDAGVTVTRMETVEEVFSVVDFYYMTRPQLERMESSDAQKIEELMARYKIDLEKVADFTGRVLHPLPINSEVSEIAYAAYFHESQGFFAQAENGIFLRKALLYELLQGHTYRQFTSTIPETLLHGNNCLHRKASSQKKNDASRIVKTLQSGIVIDHLQKGAEIQVSHALRLVERGFNSVQAIVQEKTTSFLKTNLDELTVRELKLIDSISPEPTINYIRNGEIVKKIVFLLCKNKNCISRDLLEGVPPKFYFSDGIRCRYCRHQFSFCHAKITAEEKQSFIDSLPTTVEPI